MGLDSPEEHQGEVTSEDEDKQYNKGQRRSISPDPGCWTKRA